MGVYLNPRQASFVEAANSSVYIDKTLMTAFLPA